MCTSARNSIFLKFRAGTVVLFLLLPFTTDLGAASAGEWHFKKAYRLEKEKPEESITLYRRALRLGLDSKLRQAARWRLFFLYQKTQRFADAWIAKDGLGSTKKIKYVVERLRDNMRFAWKVDETTLDLYLRGIGELYGAGARATDDRGEYLFMRHFRAALARAPENQRFHREIQERLREKGFERSADRLPFQGTRRPQNTVDDLLERASRLFVYNELNEAEDVLRRLALRDEEMEDGHRARLLYLLGRIYRKRGHFDKAVPYFRLSARYSSDKLSVRRVALAAYALYKEGFADQAHALMRDLPESPDANIKLLALILRAEIDADESALRELARADKAGQFKNRSFLNIRAREILERREKEGP